MLVDNESVFMRTCDCEWQITKRHHLYKGMYNAETLTSAFKEREGTKHYLAVLTYNAIDASLLENKSNNSS
jgi:hypothetical protein